MLVGLAFGSGWFIHPEPIVIQEEVVETETEVVYENRTYPFSDVTADFNYQADRNKLTVEKTGLRKLDYGDSMQPTMYTGNLFMTQSYNGQDLEPGMIVGAYQPAKDTIWVHRVTRVNEERGLVWTQGDNNKEPELNDIENIRYIVTGVLYTDIEQDYTRHENIAR